MASSPGSSLWRAPSLKKSRRIPENSPQIKYMYQLSCPEGCISKSAAIRDYKLKESDFANLQPTKVVPNPHCPSKNAYWFKCAEVESYVLGRNAKTLKSSEIKPGTPSPVKALRKKIRGFAFNMEDKEAVTLLTRDALNSKEDDPPLRKKRRVTIASIEILDDGSVLDLPMEKD